MSLVFEWHPRKAQANIRKHNVSFAEAVLVFSDPLARIFLDEEHSADEQREIIIGHSTARRLLLVSFAEQGSERVGIISARPVTKRERQDYEEYTTN
ncbi:MAG TPA: BrnT family toxin [Candidatus Acidoferrales bacterium]|jgi:uncharacterized DUF497 family protein|nr:BrnT family toxin [Candidatus Acidoferrales bacterium]